MSKSAQHQSFYVSMDYYHNQARELRSQAIRETFSALAKLPKRIAGRG